MRISYKWLSELVDLSGVQGTEALGDLLTRRGLELEAIERQDQGFEKVITAQILERAPHPQSDRLSLCRVTIGSGEPLEIVCGAQNMKAGDKVALAQIGAELPNGLKIAQSKIRGVTSNGMLCSEEELKLAGSSEGILILPAATPLGQPLSQILGRDDTILTFKLTANRGDCLSHFGMAREVAAALGKQAKRPSATELKFDRTSIAIELNAGDAAPQFYGAVIEGVKIGPSPDWVVKRLEALGSRSINNVVDATNLLMLELGQPVHAYDATLIRGGKIQVRMAREGEVLPLLDGSSVKCLGTELVIADGEGAIGLAGVMGGGNSEVRPETTKIFLECAEFSPSLVRKASSKHQKKTDAAYRFERGVDAEGLPHAIARLAKLVTELAGGKVQSAQGVRGPMRASIGTGATRKKIRVNPAYFGEFLGMTVSSAEAEGVLVGLGCTVDSGAEAWMVTPPSFRLDLSIPEDLAEEIARSLGYERILETIPILSSSPTSMEGAFSELELGLQLLDRAKDALRTAGLQETLNFSFTSKQWLSELGLVSTAKVVNPLSDEYEFLVPSLLPGLLKNAVDNTRRHFGSEALAIRLFEIRPTFIAPTEIRSSSETETHVSERWRLSFVLSGSRFAKALRTEQGELDFYDVKSIFEGMLDRLGTRGVRLGSVGAFPGGASLETAHLFHPGKTAEVLIGKEIAGYIGLLHPALERRLKLRAPLWIAEIDWDGLKKLSRPVTEAAPFKAWSEFPPIERDFALVVRSEITADKITQLALRAGKPLAKIAKVFDVYRGSQVQEGMTSVAVRVIFYDESRSLQESEAEAASAQILSTWKKELGAELRG